MDGCGPFQAVGRSRSLPLCSYIVRHLQSLSGAGQSAYFRGLRSINSSSFYPLSLSLYVYAGCSFVLEHGWTDSLTSHIIIRQHDMLVKFCAEKQYVVNQKMIIIMLTIKIKSGIRKPNPKSGIPPTTSGNIWNPANFTSGTCLM